MNGAYVGWPGLIAGERPTKAYEGTGIFESASGMVDSGFRGDVPGFAGNGVAAGLAAIGAVMDPLQVVFAAGVGWLMEHVAILREPLDKLMGDPKAIDAHAQSWKNIEQRIYDATDLFVDEVNRTTTAWTAASADAYRQRAREHAESIQAMGKLADGMGRATTVLGAMVGIARNTVRDIVAEVVGACISAAMQAVSVVLIPKMVAEISMLVSKASLKIFTVVKRLMTTIENTGLFVRQMQAMMSQIGQSSRNVLRLEAHRIEAVGTAGQGWRGTADAYRLLSEGHIRAHGAVGQVMVNTARTAAQGNTSQNTGSGASDTIEGNPAPPPIGVEP
ncbi:hypothetical protein [Actinoplanes sp. NPDC023714]|uniref:hypothetical protein n=1 Tax=Actinoplanes sp. NPDC023714 TaxID=3154322 RepID=UPI0033CCB9C2